MADLSLINIFGTLHNVKSDNTIAESSQIYDDVAGKSVFQINFNSLKFKGSVSTLPLDPQIGDCYVYSNKLVAYLPDVATQGNLNTTNLKYKGLVSELPSSNVDEGSCYRLGTESSYVWKLYKNGVFETLAFTWVDIILNAQGSTDALNFKGDTTTTTAPASPNPGDCYLFTDVCQLRVWKDSAWKTIADVGAGHTYDSTKDSISEGVKAIYAFNTASGIRSHAEGVGTTASGTYSHAEGFHSQAIAANYSSNTLTADGVYENGRICHAEGNATIAQGYNSHAEGKKTFAKGNVSHAEGSYTIASGFISHTEGDSTVASGVASHAEGNNTTASGYVSHAEGFNTIAQNNYEHAEGAWNKSNKQTTGTDVEKLAKSTLHSIGIGTGEANRVNAVEVMKSGDVYIKGLGGYDGTNPGSGSTPLHQSVKTIQTPVADPTASGNATAFIDSITQDANGVITVTKKNVPTVTQTTHAATADTNAGGKILVSKDTAGTITYEWKDPVIIDDNSVSSTVTWSADKLNTILGNISATLTSIIGAS